jgi:tetratricopeptide (TPR) repeat protein
VLRYNYAAFLKNTGKDRKALEQFDKAEQICNKILAEKPRESGIYRALGNIFAEKGDFTRAVENFRKALDLEPDNPENHTNLIQALDVGGNLDSAIQAAQKSVEYFQSRNRMQDAENIKQYLNQLKGQK